ncbi:MAG: Fe-S cluster assembly protein SufD [Rhodobacteraceae bacterium]|nr:Fe-S cluster assembly protein SufD [Paracoccaceae bacterium]
MLLDVAKRDALAARIANLSIPTGGGWLGAARAEALARLLAMGLPGKRDEYWRYTDPSSLTTAVPPKTPLFATDNELMPFSGLDRLKLVFIDGVFDAVQSDDLALAGVEIERLGIAGRSDIHWAQSLYGVLEARGQMPVERPLSALNSAFATDGVLVRVKGNAERPISLIYHSNSENSDAILHHCVSVEEGAEITILENGPAGARFNKVIEVDLAKGARFHHISAQGRNHQCRAVTHIFARLAEGALFKSFTLTANSLLTRNEAVIELLGDDAMAHVAGAALGDRNFHHDDTVFVTHAGQRCESRQVFKNVLKNGAVGVFQGKILVKNGAQKTDGYQISQSLLLDGDSQFFAKPELEIYADDVKCSHGSTSGAIDETALFYLRSRGVPTQMAQGLLVLAFLAEAISEIDDNSISDLIRAQLEGWLV